MKYLSLFSGIGAFESALRNMEIPFDLVGFSEIDKYAVKSYCEIHNVSESLNLGDITKIDETKLPEVDLITYGFPCQDISLAGKQKGLFNDDGTKTRSGLFFDALRIIEATKPKVAIAENVKNLVGKKFAEQFQIVLKSLEDAGYNNYWKVLNAKDYGVPQNRERVFVVSIRKDVDTGCFEFPEGYPLRLRLKDLLEEIVDEKYYLKEVQSFFIKNSFDMETKGNGFRFEPHILKNADVAKTIKTTAGSRMEDNFVLDGDFDTPTFKFDSTNPLTDKVIQIGNCRPTKTRANPNQGRVDDTEGLAPCLNQMGGGNREPHIVEPKINVVGNYSPSNHDASRIVHPEGLAPTVKENHGTVTAVVEPLAYDEQNKYLRKDGCVGTIMTDGSSPKKNSRVIQEDLRIRKLTPKECFRLMGFKDEEFAKAEAVNSNTQLYKQAGNSIVVDVAEKLLGKIIDCGVL